MKYIFTGAQSTGKSTILNHFEEQGYPTITEVVRNLAKQGVKVNEMGDEKSQQLIFNTYYDLLSNEKDYVSDRGLIDVMAYTTYLYSHGKISREIYEYQLGMTGKFLDDHIDDTVYFYFPIEFPVADDGFRSTDEEFRKEIDINILNLLIKFEIVFIEVKGSVEERIDIVNRTMMIKP